MEIALGLIFIIGYIMIATEHAVKLNKAASALLAGILCWVIYISGNSDKHLINEQLLKYVGEIAGLLFFLLSAMVIVELMDAHEGFNVIKNKFRTTKKRTLIIMLSIISFFLSSVLDNMTTSIVMVSLLSKLVDDKNDRLIFSGLIIIAANAGGAWTPIGDVTTTMLWLGGQITTLNTIVKLFIPSLVSLLVPMIYFMLTMKGNVTSPQKKEGSSKISTTIFERNFALFMGLGTLISVPIFKTLTHLPPFMGILFGLSIFWIFTEIIHKEKEDEAKAEFSVAGALQRIDVTTVLFFLGILLCINALQAVGLLQHTAQFLEKNVGNQNIIVIIIGLLSAVVDNVPLVAAAMGMYPMAQYAADSNLWQFIAYCAGTGGSILIIGSAAGVAVMGIEKINFFSYMKKISIPALLGYFAGALVYLFFTYRFHV